MKHGEIGVVIWDAAFRVTACPAELDGVVL